MTETMAILVEFLREKGYNPTVSTNPIGGAIEFLGGEVVVG